MHVRTRATARALELFFADATDPENFVRQDYPHFFELLEMLDERVFLALDKPESVKFNEYYTSEMSSLLKKIKKETNGHIKLGLMISIST